MEFRKIKIADLIPASYNPRKKLKKGDREYEKIRNSITEFGYVEPVIVNSDMTIIGGHQRVSVLSDLGYEEIDCIVIDIDKQKEKALNIALNKITGEWNKELLADLIADLQDSDFDVSFTGFEPPEIEQLFNSVHDKKVTEDDFDIDAELEKPAVAKMGDVWTLGRHRLMVGDSTLPETYDVLMAGAKANLVVTDPPYNANYEGSAGKIKNDNMPDKEFYQFLFAAFVNMEQNMESDASTAIMGKAKATADQMKSYLKKKNPSVPQSVLDMVPLYLSEGEAEGVRGDIAFAQSCLETGNFTFSGSAVTLPQNNFCGLGVTQRGRTGLSFETAQLGIRAQIQHLKAYASTDKLRKARIDPRFRYVTRGCAPYAEWLGQKENPQGKGWAAGEKYGEKILSILKAVISEGKVQFMESLILSAPYTVRISIPDLNIRRGPGTSYSKTGKFTGVGIFTIVEEKDGWGLLKAYAEKRDGWIALAFTTRI